MLSDSVKEFIRRHPPQSSRIIVGLSGGADSMALLLALKEAGCNLIAAHCNFHLRGEESERDRRYCEEVCRELGIELLIKDFDVAARRKATSESIEMACRSLRYEWWHELIKTGVGDYLCVGHHREDNIETFFLNLMRGSGIAGLKGMLPISGYIIRPMLEITRSEIEQYVTSQGYTWVNDRTNNENEYKRNKLRNIILPLIEREFPGASDAMTRTLGILRQNYAVYRKTVYENSRKYIHEDGAIDIGGMLRHEDEAPTLIHEILSADGFNHAQIDDIIRCVEAKNSTTASGQKFMTHRCTYTLENGILSKATARDDTEYDADFISAPFFAEEISIEEFNQIKSSRQFQDNIIYVDKIAFDGNPKWTWRTWRQNDRLQPFGMKGSRLVSDIFSDAKLTANQKNTIPLLFRNGMLLWVAGLRASRHFKITESTTSVIKITFE